MEVTICGARGSTPAPGAEFVRYGGHTSCLAVARDGEVPHLLLDAGTGIRRVTALLGGAPFVGTILLGHLHWDHTQGIPFFSAGDRPDASVTVCVPSDGDPEAALEKMMSVPNFPITPRQLRGDWTFVALEPGRHVVEGFDVLALEIPHKGGRTFGYRVSDGVSSIAYLSDHCPIALGPGPAGLGEYHPAALALATGCDVLIHDAQYTDQELPARATWGHSAIGYAVGLGEAAGVGRVLLHHHDPPRTDDAVDAIVAAYAGADVPVAAAVEGSVLVLGA
ncbi:MAG TPA: MBL fold metallo-hydrolase [Acidimicrobiales bacterium]|nr:MBL fold metallo-hydrolase [Acidimicrobiales bacterium]